MGPPASARLVLLVEGWRRRRALFMGAHHSCLGSRRALPYSADRGKKSVNRQTLDDLKRQIPLMGYLQAHDWHPARPLSRGRWMGLCPLHGDRQPSFLVDTNKDLFYCYGCGRGGDVIRFAELYHQVKFPQAVAWLCQWRGAEPLLQEAARFYGIQLHRHSEAVAYLHQRGIRSQ
jgi:DNA primase